MSDNDPRQIPVFNAVYEQKKITAAAAVDMPAGTVLGYSSVNNDVRLVASGAVDSANVRYVLRNEVKFDAAGSKYVRVVSKGEVYEDKLVFQGADTLDTVPANTNFAKASFREQLKDAGIIVRPVVDDREYDN